MNLTTIIVKKNSQFHKVCEDDCGCITELKQEISERWYSRHDEHVVGENQKLTDKQKLAQRDADNEWDQKQRQRN